MIDTTKLNIFNKQKLPSQPLAPQPDPYQAQPTMDQQPLMGQQTTNWSMPNWMPQGTYDWWGRNPDPGFGTPDQPWYRHPSWGDDAVYNPHYGYQNVRDIADLYGSGQDFWNFGLTPQTDQDWSGYGFTRPDRTQITRDQLADPGGGDGAQMPTKSIADWLQGLFNPNYSDLPYYPDADVGPGQGFQYPGQWDTASDVLTNFAYGDPTQVPWQWDVASQMGADMSETGLPVDVAGYKEAMMPVMQRQYSDMAKDVMEQMGLMGLSDSSSAQRQIADIGGRLAQEYGLGLADRELGAQESARQRQLSGGGLLQGLGSGVAGLGEAARNRALQAGGMLPGLGQQYLQAPQDWAQRMWGMGTQQQGIMQQALDRAYQDFMRMAPEYSPWLQQAMGYVGLPPFLGQQQYGQSGMGSLFGGLMSMLPFMLGLGG